MRRPPRSVVGLGLGVILAVGGCTGSPSQPSPDHDRPSLATSATPASTAAPASATIPPASTSPVATVLPAPMSARDAELSGPAGLALDPAGNLYVSQCDWTVASSILRVDPDGNLTTFAGTGVPGFAGDGGPATSAQLYCPAGLAFGPDGALYVADHINNRVRRIDRAGMISTVAGSGPAGLDRGSFSGDGGPATAATLQEPWGVALDRLGDLFIADRDNHRVRKVDAQGIISTIAGNGEIAYSGEGVLGSKAGIGLPLGITADAHGNVLFADSTNLRVRMIDGHGKISTIAGTGNRDATGDGGPATKAALADPENLLIDRSGNLDITDTVFGGFRQIDRDGIISRVVGGTSAADIPDDGTDVFGAPFAGITGMAMDASGNLYVEAGNGVYRIDAKGILTRVAGRR